MNKQELKQLILATDYAGTTVSKEFKKGFREGMKISADMLEQLDEPQKLVVPKFVAEWFEENKDDLEFPIWELCVDSYGSKDEHGMLNWIQQSENNPIETLIRMKDGYEVEKKPKYIVKIGKLYLKEPLGDTSNFTILTTWDKKCAYPFSSFHMADIHAAKFEGTVEEVAEG
ncbi:DUF1642 domain-containing protein [Enterococcus faecium]|uniref:DUF1642 domain-containing protein n=1 Tax=Enterococcus faecium TaxID=1352 RepID=UPI001880AC3D|nr:DUF1642 domain-containing protein [Enterococcus faecium]MBE8862465.1 DUF1642 domain-containing protein [Enterococcus faecium]